MAAIVVGGWQAHTVPVSANLNMPGRYNKFSRTLSQTPWILNGERKTSSSVQVNLLQVSLVDRLQELLSDDLIKLVGATEGRFCSAGGQNIRVLSHHSIGREDVDVRMLGTGRPFTIELINPRRTVLTAEELLNLEVVGDVTIWLLTLE